MRLCALVVVAGCGRVGFAPHDRDDARRDGMTVDGGGGAVGCSDGQRDGFVDRMAFPTIAACAATWAGTPGARDSRMGGACGDDLGLGTPCISPVDACATGWHVCADSGLLSDLTSRVTATDCGTAGGLAVGAFVAAASHCQACTGGCSTEADCVYAASYTCPSAVVDCAQAVCCGPDCISNENCKGGAFPVPQTHVSSNVCGALPGNSQTGVLCCAD